MESNFLTISQAESWISGEVLRCSGVLLLWTSAYLWKIASGIIFYVKLK